MSLAMQDGLDELRRWDTPNAIKYMVLLTDGVTYGDTDLCRQLAQKAASDGVSIIPFGIGSDWDKSLLDEIGRLSGGMDVQLLEAPKDMVATFNQQALSESAAAVLNTVLTLRLPTGVSFRKAVTISPIIQHVNPSALSENQVVLPLENWEKDTAQYMLIELMTNPRPLGRSRITQVTLTYDIPTMGIVGAHTLDDILVTFTDDANRVTQINTQVMDFVERALEIANKTGGIICDECGFENRPGAKFCVIDGKTLVQGIATVPPQRSQTAYPVIQARPVQVTPPPRTIRARPVQSIQTRSAGGNDNTSDPQVLYHEGLQLLNSKKFLEAIARFKQAQSGGYASYDVLYNLGRAHHQYGQSVYNGDTKLFTQNMTLAAEYFEEALTVKKDAPDACFQLGMCYRDLDLFLNATNTFKKALALTPQDPAIYYQLGLVALKLRTYKGAEAYLNDGLKINPDHVGILIALGQLYIETKQLSTAIKRLREATQRDPNIWEGWYYLGYAHMKQREWSYALSALERGRQVKGDVIDIFTAMATCWLKLNKKAEARQMVNEALQRDPKNPEALRLQNQL